MSRIPDGRACESDYPDFQQLNDELPDDIADDEKYAAIPDRQELGLGKPLVLDFAREFLPNDFEEVHGERRRAEPIA